MFIPLKTESGKRSRERDWCSCTTPTASRPCRRTGNVGSHNRQHLRSSTHVRCRQHPLGSSPAKQWKKIDPDRESSSTTVCIWWRPLQCPMSPNPVCMFQSGEPHVREGESERGEERMGKSIGVQEGAPLVDTGFWHGSKRL